MAFITPISCTRSDMVTETRKEITNAPATKLRMLTTRIKRENMKENPGVRVPSVARVTSKPRFSPKAKRKTVVAVQMINPVMVRRVWNFLRAKSLIGKARSLIYRHKLPNAQMQDAIG